MVIHTRNQDYKVIYHNKNTEHFEIMIGQNESESADIHYTLLRFCEEKEIRWLLDQNLMEREGLADCSDFRESFIWNDSLIMVFLREEGIRFDTWISTENASLDRRLEIGKCLLERLLLLNMPDYLLGSILNTDCILITKQSEVIIRYEPKEILIQSQETGKSIQDGFFQIFLRLFQQEELEHVSMELHGFLEQFQQKSFQDVFFVYQSYLAMQDSRKEWETISQKSKLFLKPIGTKLQFIVKKIWMTVLLIVMMALLIYGICHTNTEQSEDDRIEKIGNLTIR